MHFPLGDALVFCALGHLSPAARDALTESEEERGREEELGWLLDKLTREHTPQAHPEDPAGHGGHLGGLLVPETMNSEDKFLSEILAELKREMNRSNVLPPEQTFLLGRLTKSEKNRI